MHHFYEFVNSFNSCQLPFVTTHFKLDKCKNILQRDIILLSKDHSASSLYHQSYIRFRNRKFPTYSAKYLYVKNRSDIYSFHKQVG